MKDRNIKLLYIKLLKKYQEGKKIDKVKELRNKHPILDFFSGFIPGISEAQDVLDFYYAAKEKSLLGMSLAAAGLILPLSGGLIRKILSKADFQKWADSTLGLISKTRPQLSELIILGNPQAKKIEKAYLEVANGNFIIPEKRGLIDANENSVIIPILHPHSSNMTPEAAIDASIKFGVTTPKGKVVPYIIGGNKGVSDIKGLFIVGKGTIKGGKESALFTSLDILTALYYSGHGKQKGANKLYDYILGTSTSKESKEFALEKLSTIEEILAKYSKNPEQYKRGLNKATNNSKKGREIAYNSDGSINIRSYGLIPESLANPKNEQAVKDYLKLEDSLFELSSWLGSKNTDSVILMYLKVPINTYIGNFRGKSFDTPGASLDLLGPSSNIKATNADVAAKQIAGMKDNSLGIITNIQDGVLPTTDIIMLPGRYSALEFKNGGSLNKSNFKQKLFKKA